MYCIGVHVKRILALIHLVVSHVTHAVDQGKDNQVMLLWHIDLGGQNLHQKGRWSAGCAHWLEWALSLVLILKVYISSFSHMLYQEAYHLSLTFLWWSNLLFGISLVVAIFLLLILIFEEGIFDLCCLLTSVFFDMVVIKHWILYLNCLGRKTFFKEYWIEAIIDITGVVVHKHLGLGHHLLKGAFVGHLDFWLANFSAIELELCELVHVTEHH